MFTTHAMFVHKICDSWPECPLRQQMLKCTKNFERNFYCFAAEICIIRTGEEVAGWLFIREKVVCAPLGSQPKTDLIEKEVSNCACWI